VQDAAGEGEVPPAQREQLAHPIASGALSAVRTRRPARQSARHAGYGDVAAETQEGKLLSAVVMLVGIGFVAVVTGAIAQRFVVSEDTITEGNRETFRLQQVTHDKLDALSERLDALEQQIREREP
jgi:hypothetical protein